MYVCKKQIIISTQHVPCHFLRHNITPIMIKNIDTMTITTIITADRDDQRAEQRGNTQPVNM